MEYKMENDRTQSMKNIHENTMKRMQSFCETCNKHKKDVCSDCQLKQWIQTENSRKSSLSDVMGMSNCACPPNSPSHA
jgi:hypothetical protein